MVEPSAMMYQILLLKDKINARAASINGGEPVFRVVPSFRQPDFEQHSMEFSLLQTISWFYSMYNEIGKPDIIYLGNLLETYSLDENGEIRQHRIIVDRLRTYFQHHLDLNSDTDRRTIELSTEWFKKHCGSQYPLQNDEWSQCLLGLLSEAQIFFKALLECIVFVENDESRETMIQVWNFRRNRYHAPHEFDRIISIAANDMGLMNIDAANLRKKYYEDWRKQLDYYNVEYDFDIEARRLIEKTLTSNLKVLAPITGADIIAALSLSPGPVIRELKSLAENLYEANPTLGKSDLLAEIEVYYRKNYPLKVNN